MKETVEKDLLQPMKEGVFLGINTKKSPEFLTGYSNKNTNLVIAKAGHGMAFNCKKGILKEME